jgi:formylglycine-generating enzyme required for sulfatase activity
MGSNPSYFKGDVLPVEQVSWEDCQEYCQRLAKQSGKHSRLPTEAEWEYACRAGTTTPFFFGKTLSTDLANCDGNYPCEREQKGIYRNQSTPVGSFPPNAWCLYDMHGNAWEWCLDRFDSYSEEDQQDPQQDFGQACLMRGGSWGTFPWCCRSARRETGRRDSRYNTTGCRVVLCLD